VFRTDRHVDDGALVARRHHELSASRAAAIDAHLETCESCRTRADALVGAEMSVRMAVRSHADPDHHLRARAALTRALDREADHPRPLVSRVAAVLAPALAMAAAVAVAIALAYGARSRAVADTDSSPVLPIARLTPGATASLTASQLCSGETPSRAVPAAVARRVLRAYAMEDLSPAEYELDALITPELGGTTAVENLWPQRYTGGVWTAYVKDEIEDHLRDLVCGGALDLRTAQHDMATNWIAAYQKYFGRDLPTPARQSFDVSRHGAP